ncbi:replication factor RFC1 C terminal domain-containing protein [Podospora fimiseda]|uniref:Replication factor C subunit 1 n=1 Tax=Podospora fimiseda TaxID=252190 RepID=A0AAN7BRT1_9PEZI|nr:replication factor RFC1 C terminal domain-containing protein [Podospora fimiseda]
MPDIRNFFAPKGGAPPSKPAPKKVEEPPKKRAKGRKVIEDSDEEEEVVETKKPVKAPAPRKKATTTEVKGTETTASKYFSQPRPKLASAQATDADPKPKDPPKMSSKTIIRPAESESSDSDAFDSKKSVTPKKAATPKNKAAVPDLPVRASPRTRSVAVKAEPALAKKVTNSTKKPVKALKDDEDAFMDDDEDGGDDIFAADAKGRNKRKNDDYEDEDSEEEFKPKPKRVATRGGKVIKEESESDEEEEEEEVKKPAKKVAASGKKRKSPVTDSEEEEVKKPVKKAAKPRAPRAKKDAEPEPDDVKAIIDNIPTVQAPDAPPPDPNAKFDWRNKAPGGGNSGPPPMAGAAEIPEGEEDCLAGKTFVFTGLLKTIAREEAQALVKRYGGKVTGAPSSRTDFVVLGDDAGPSKLRKIKELKIKTIDEEGLFYLIRTMPAGGGGGKGAEKAKQRREEEENKAREEAARMDKEEKARKAEEAKAAKAAAAARGVAAPVKAPAPSFAQLWTTKYAPTAINQICGNKGNVEKIQNWLKMWPKNKAVDFQKRGADGMGGARAIIISGPPGIGKTTSAHLAANLEGYDVLEFNASDVRSKKLIDYSVSDVINNTSLLGHFAGDGKKADAGKKKIVLIMDEVDGMSAGDRGGVGAIAKLCKKTEVPLILICNERRLPKMKPFDHVAFDIKFQRPTVDQIRSRVMTICHREGLKMPPQVVNALIEGAGKDIRQVINMLSTAKLDSATMDFDQTKEMTKAWEKHVILKPWDICQKMIGGGLFSPSSTATLNDKIELYFNDHEFSFLMIQENYLRAKPNALGGMGLHPKEQNLRYLELVDKAAESISDGDLVDRMIHGPQQHWSLMPTHAVFSTVKPASYIAGQFGGQPTFTSWLGNNSKYGKLSRYLREIHAHMRLKCSGDHHEIRQQYLPVLWNQLIKKLQVEGKESVKEVIELMDDYYLTREDFDFIMELGVGEQDMEQVNIETQTKSAFTRTYNAMSHPVPFMRASNLSLAPKKVSKDMPDLEEVIEEEDDAALVDDAPEADPEDDVDLSKDKYVKAKKPDAKGKAKAPAKKKAAAKAADLDDEDEVDDVKPAKGKGKAAAKPRGRPKKA